MTASALDRLVCFGAALPRRSQSASFRSAEVNNGASFFGYPATDLGFQKSARTSAAMPIVDKPHRVEQFMDNRVSYEGGSLDPREHGVRFENDPLPEIKVRSWKSGVGDIGQFASGMVAGIVGQVVADKISPHNALLNIIENTGTTTLTNAILVGAGNMAKRSAILAMREGLTGAGGGVLSGGLTAAVD